MFGIDDAVRDWCGTRFHPPSWSGGGRAKSSALCSGDIARPMQAGRVTPESPAWVNEVMTKPPVSRGDVVHPYAAVAALPGLSTCTQKIVQAGDNRNNKKIVA